MDTATDETPAEEAAPAESEPAPPEEAVLRRRLILTRLKLLRPMLLKVETAAEETPAEVDAAPDDENRVPQPEPEPEPEPEPGPHPKPEQARQLASQRKGLHGKVREILDCIEKELEKAEVTQSRESLRVQHELLMKTELWLRRAKKLTKELRDHNNGEGLELNRWQMELVTWIAGFKDSWKAVAIKAATLKSKEKVKKAKKKKEEVEEKKNAEVGDAPSPKAVNRNKGVKNQGKQSKSEELLPRRKKSALTITVTRKRR